MPGDGGPSAAGGERLPRRAERQLRLRSGSLLDGGVHVRRRRSLPAGPGEPGGEGVLLLHSPRAHERGFFRVPGAGICGEHGDDWLRDGQGQRRRALSADRGIRGGGLHLHLRLAPPGKAVSGSLPRTGDGGEGTGEFLPAVLQRCGEDGTGRGWDDGVHGGLLREDFVGCEPGAVKLRAPGRLQDLLGPGRPGGRGGSGESRGDGGDG